MTPVLVPNEKLSPFSVGALEDIGYTVSYSLAANYNYNDLGDACKCGGRRTLFGQEVEDEEENVMSLRQPQPPAPRKLTARQLQDGQKLAEDFIAAEIAANGNNQRSANDECHGYDVYVTIDGQLHSFDVACP